MMDAFEAWLNGDAKYLYNSRIYDESEPDYLLVERAFKAGYEAGARDTETKMTTEGL